MLVPFISSANEFKTKPTQHSVKGFGLGIQPDILCRTGKFSKESRQKISHYNPSLDSIIMVENAKSIYEVPLKLYNEGALKQIYSHFNIRKKIK